MNYYKNQMLHLLCILLTLETIVYTILTKNQFNVVRDAIQGILRFRLRKHIKITLI